MSLFIYDDYLLDLGINDEFMYEFISFRYLYLKVYLSMFYHYKELFVKVILFAIMIFLSVLLMINDVVNNFKLYDWIQLNVILF